MMVGSGDGRDGDGDAFPADDAADSDSFDPEAYEIEEQLTLADDDDHLPWLESEDDYVEPGLDTRIIAIAVAGLLAVLALVALIWWVLRDRPDSQIQPDGSLIEAPDEPYRTRPDDPGGSEVAGTGDVSFEVGEGQSVEGQIASEAPAPSIDIDAQDDAQDKQPQASSGVGVQVGAYSTQSAAQAGWSELSRRFEVLHGVGHRVVEGTVDSGTIYRLQAIASDKAAADALCRSIRQAGGDCQVKN
jgi:hypothetical protein